MKISVRKFGWQSWSTKDSIGNKFKIPRFNFAPPNKGESRFTSSYTEKIHLKSPVSGWCSWYAFGNKISEEKILEQARWFKNYKKLPVEYILIDDGWTKWGDWLMHDRDKFPGGMLKVSDSIRRLGFKPAIWFAPFLVDRNSRLAEVNSDWLVSIKSRFIDGYNLTSWDKFMPYGKYLLNIKKKQVFSYLYHCLDRLLNKYKFQLIKLDFLYGIYFDPGLGNTEADFFLHNFFVYLRKNFPRVYTIACGCPLAPAVGAVDSMRIGPDSIIINPQINLPIVRGYLNQRRHRQILDNLKWRSRTRRYWNPDPDVYLCRTSLGFSDQKLLNWQKEVKKLKGNIFLGDDMTQLSYRRIEKYVLPLFE
ncbi:alpha-galactosidase [Candidatus Gottesmanbacteria bacterium]|nr:alpha-galactosidase [Candidatus Gottesmanbacteria bacterium]